jgi:hypothetical protein
VITGTTADGRVVIVNLSTRTAVADLSCVLQPGEHEMVVRESVIAYTHARLQSVLLLRRQIAHRIAERHAPANPALVDRIRIGAPASEMTPEDVADAIRRCRWRPA